MPTADLRPEGNFLKRFIVFLFAELAERAWSVARAWQERPGLMVFFSVLVLALFVAQLIFFTNPPWA